MQSRRPTGTPISAPGDLGSGTPGSAQSPGWLRRLSGACLEHPVLVVGSMVAALVGTAAAAVSPLVVRTVVDDVIIARSQPMVPWIVALLAIGLVNFGGGFVRRYLGGKLSIDVQNDLRQRVFGSLVRLDGRKQDDLETGQVVSRSISDLNLVQSLLAMVPLTTANVLLFVMSVIIMFTLSPPLTVAALLVGPGLLVVALVGRRRLYPANWDAQQRTAEVAGVIESAVTGVRVVKGFGQEDREVGRLEAAARRLFGSRLRTVELNSIYNPLMQLIPALGQVAVLGLGGYLALRGELTLGTFLAFSTYLGAMVSPVRMLAGLLTVAQQARAGVVRVFEVVDARSDVVDRPAAVVLPDGPADVELVDVTFGYERDRPVLDHFCLRVAAGETVALVGAAGSGKSTVSLLLTRFYDVDAGAVRVGGHDVRDLTLSSLRSRIGVVFDDSFLFSDTVAANIGYGRPGVTDVEVEAAARAAQAHGFISELPHGYDTTVGEQGLTLSGGQRQRVALARALLRDPQLLVLDDATSAVDSRVEAEIHHSLRTAMVGRTTILVAHRRSTLALADRIAVVQDGRVLDVGTDAELQQRCPRYVELLTGPDADEPAATGHPPVAGTLPITAAAWPPVAPDTAGVGGMFASQPTTPGLLEQVRALAPTRDEPAVPPELVRRPDPHFSFRSLLRVFRAPLLVGLLLVAADAVAQLVLPAAIRLGVDQGVTQQRGEVVVAATVLALAVTLVDAVVMVAQIRVTGRTGERVLYLLRTKLFAQLQRLGLDFYEREMGGRIMTRMTTDVDALSTFIQTGLATAVVSVLTFVGVLVALLVTNLELALVTLAVLPVLVAATLVFRAKSKSAYETARERISGVNADFQENVAGVRITQAYGRETHNADRFADRSQQYRAARTRSQRYIATFFPFVAFVSDVATALVLGFGATQVQAGTLTVGALIAFMLYVSMFFSPVQQLSQVFDAYQQAQVGLRRIGTLLRTSTSTPAPAVPVRITGPLRGEIELRDVSFAYAGSDEPALRDLHLQIPAGQRVAVVGETGAGKSTVMKLLARFYDPSAGTVLVDGVDVAAYDLAGYRHRLGYVPQEAYLFAGTVRDAIAYGRPEATDAEVEAAARAVGAHAMIASLGDGYRHQVGERGRNLSAGQRQLIALARAECVDPDVLLLDEATAALDLASEAVVTRAQDRLAHRRTTVVIAHRLTTAARADRIWVMEHGRVVQDGTHADLLGQDGPYARLWAAFEAVPVG